MRALHLALMAALAPALIGSPASAQDPRGKPIAAPSGYLPGTAIYCDDGTNHAVPCSFNGSGNPGGDPGNVTADGGTAPIKTGVVGGVGADGLAHRFVTDNAGRIVSVVYTLPLPAGAATATGQASNIAAITGSQAPTGSLATTSTTVTTTLPQLTATAGRATSFGTAAATLFDANPSRHFIAVQIQGTPDGTGAQGCYINGTTAASADANSLFIARGGYFESSTHIGVGAISIICTAANTAVYSRQG